MEQSFRRDISELEKMFSFIEEALRHYAFGDRNSFPIKFVTEELFTNMLKYGGGSTGRVHMRIVPEGENCVVTLTEDDAEPFDVGAAPDVDISKGIEDRVPGGLGIYLVHKLVDSLEYKHADGANVIKFKKRLEKQHV